MTPADAARLRGEAEAAERAFAAMRAAFVRLAEDAANVLSAAQARRVRERVEADEPLFDAIVGVLDDDEPPF